MNVDWTDCELTERVPGKVGGQVVVKRTRIRADTIVSNYEAGSPIEEIAENYPSLPVSKIRKMIAYANSH